MISNDVMLQGKFTLKTLFNIVEDRLKKLLNFDVSAVMMFRKVNKQPGMQKFEIDAVTIKK